ncbi:MAG: DUF481 domain-containing protein [Gemmatimonadaceae bacterium]
MPLRALLTVAIVVLAAAPAAAQDAPAVVTTFTADFGYVATSGNTEVTTMSVGEKLTQERGRWALSQTFALVYGEQDGAVNTNNLRAGVRGDYQLDQLFALFVGGGFDRNRFAGIERRFEQQLGVQLRALAAQRDTVRLEAGATATQQGAVGGGRSTFPSARGAAIWRHAFTDAAYFQQNVETIANLDETDDWRVNTESALIAPVSQRIGLKVSFVIRYDNVPEAGFSTTDRLFTTGLQLTF